MDKSYTFEPSTENSGFRSMTGALEAGAGFLQHPGVEYWRRTNPVTHTYLPLDNSFNRIFKRVMDVLFSLFVIIFVLSWFIPLAAIIIKTGSAGPVFFRQKRIKRNGKVFTCIKFRTMQVNEEADWLPAAKNDRRITHTGKFFREYFLDELPQFFNVLTGDMSIVGPRPHMLEDEKKFQSIADHYTLRNKVKPGITGLAQVTGYLGAAESMEEINGRTHMDLYYLQHWTLKTDFLILMRTLGKIFRL